MGIKKFISLFTVLCFLTTFAGQNLSWAAEEIRSNAGIEEFKKIFETVPKIPAEYGKVTSIKDFGSKSVIVNIQDLHCHPQAQKNIAKIIEILDANYNVTNIFVEGAYGKIDTSWLTNISNKELKDSLIEEMFEQGRLNASEYYGIKNQKSGLLFGLENEKSHKENIARLGYILENQENYKKILTELKKEIDYLDIKYTNKRNKRFNRLLEKYKSGKISSEKFYSIIGKYVKNIEEKPEKYNNILPINMQEYPNIQKYLILTKYNMKLNVKQVYSQLQSLLGLLKTNLPYQAYKTLLDETENLSNMDTLSVSLGNVCEIFDINLDINYKELDSFFKMQALNRSVNPIEMVNEEKTLIEKLRISLSYDQTESEISFLNDFYSVFSDYLESKLLSEDFAYFSKRFNTFRELYAKYAVTDNLKNIENDFSVFNAYYNLNNLRDSIFADTIFKNSQPVYGAENVLQYRSDKECLKESEEVIIVVTGGYHSKGLQELLDDKKITSLIVTPSITTDTEKAYALYEKIIKEQAVFLKEALSFTIASQAAAEEQFTAMMNAGVKFLEQAGYSQENVNSLFNELTNAVGTNAVKTPVFGQKETKIEFTNGNYIIIQNSDGKLSIRESLFDEKAEKPEITAEDKEIFSVAGEMAQSVLGNSASFLKGDFEIVYELFKNFFHFAYKNNLNTLSFAYGITHEIDAYLEAFAKDRFSLDGVDKAVIERMPDSLQNFILNRAIQNNSVIVDLDGDAVKYVKRDSLKNISANRQEPQTTAKKLLDEQKLAEEHKEKLTLLRDYLDAINQGKDRGYQQGALIDLRKSGKEIILVGDLHAREDNLEKILKTNNNEEKIKNGEAVIIFLGDIIHSEEDDKLEETESSLKIMERIMRLKISSPENVYLLAGNHDPIDQTVGKNSVPQGELYRKYIESFGPEYADLYRKAIFGSGLAAVGDNFVATHAGPVRQNNLTEAGLISLLSRDTVIENYNKHRSDASYDIENQLLQGTTSEQSEADAFLAAFQAIQELNEGFTESDSDIVNQLLWNRMANNEYSQNDIDAFLDAFKVNNGSLIVGHTPGSLSENAWHTSLGTKDNHYIIYAANDDFGYLSIKADGRKDFVTVTENTDADKKDAMTLKAGEASEVSSDLIKKGFYKIKNITSKAGAYLIIYSQGDARIVRISKDRNGNLGLKEFIYNGSRIKDDKYLTGEELAALGIEAAAGKGKDEIIIVNNSNTAKIGKYSPPSSDIRIPFSGKIDAETIENDKITARKLFGISGNAEIEIINLDDVTFFNNVLYKKTAPAAKNNIKRMIIYPHSEKVNADMLTIPQLSALYSDIYDSMTYSLITNNINEDFDYAFRELLKNALVHGNKLNVNKPIFIEYDGYSFSIYNVIGDTEISNLRLALSAASGLNGVNNGIDSVKEKETEYLQAETMSDGVKYYKVTIKEKIRAVHKSEKNYRRYIWTDENEDEIGTIYVNKRTGSVTVYAKTEVSQDDIIKALEKMIAEGEEGLDGREVTVTKQNRVKVTKIITQSYSEHLENQKPGAIFSGSEKIELLSAADAGAFDKSLFDNFFSSLSDEEKDMAAKLIISVTSNNDIYVTLPGDLAVAEDLTEDNIEALESVSPEQLIEMAKKSYIDAFIYDSDDEIPEKTFSKIAQDMIEQLWTAAPSAAAGVSKKSNYFDISKAKEFFDTLSAKEKDMAVKLISSAVSGNTYLMSPQNTEVSYREDFEHIIKELPDLTGNRLIRTAKKAGKNNALYEAIAKKMIAALWVKRTSKGNDFFERISSAIKNDEDRSICFVCSANANRSAVPYVIMRQMLEDNGNVKFKAISAGTMTEDRHRTNLGRQLDQQYINSEILNLLADKSILESFRAEEFTNAHANADFIVVAERKHKDYIIENYKDTIKDIEDRVFVFNEIVPDLNDPESVIDMRSDHSSRKRLIELADKFVSSFFDTGAALTYAENGNEIFEELKRRIQTDIPTKITFVCTANLNRSTLAHVCFEDRLRKNGNENISVFSSGTNFDRLRSLESPFGLYHRMQLQYHYGFDADIINSFSPRQFSQEDLDSDYIIAASSKHKNYILNMLEQYSGKLSKQPKVLLFSDFIPDINNPGSVLDLEADIDIQYDLLPKIYEFSGHFFEKSALTSEVILNKWYSKLLIKLFGYKGLRTVQVAIAPFAELFMRDSYGSKYGLMQMFRMFRSDETEALKMLKMFESTHKKDVSEGLNGLLKAAGNTYKKIYGALGISLIADFAAMITMIAFHAKWNYRHPDKAMAADLKTEEAQADFYNLIIGANKNTAPPNENIPAFMYYVFSGLTSMNIDAFSKKLGIEGEVKSKLASQKDGFMQSLPEEQRKTFEMIENAKNVLETAQERKSEEIDKAYNDLKSHIRSYLNNAVKQNASADLRSAEFLFFLAAFENLFAFTAKDSGYREDLNKPLVTIEIDFIWNNLLSLLNNSADDDFHSYVLFEIIKPFAQTVEQVRIFDSTYNTIRPNVIQPVRLFMDDYTERALTAFADKIESMDDLIEKSPLPEYTANSLKLFFNRLADIPPTEMEKVLAKLRESNRIINPDILKMINEFLAITELRKFLEERTALAANKPDVTKSTDYQKKMTDLDKKIANILNVFNFYYNEEIAEKAKAETAEAFGDETGMYTEIISRQSNTPKNNDFLRGVFNNRQLDIKLRLFALMYLKINKQKVDAAAIVEEYKSKADSLDIKNDFDLRASITGAQLTLMSEFDLLKNIEYDAVPHFSNIYEKIATAVILKPQIEKEEGEKYTTAAHAGLVFDTNNTDFFTIAHELGHNYLHIIAPNIVYFSAVEKTIHEFFAHTFEAFSLSMLNKKIFPKSALDFDLFTEKKYPKQQKHDAGRGMVRSIINVFGIMKMELSWLHLIEAIAGFAAQSGKEYRNSLKSQSEAFSSFVNAYSKMLSEKYPETDIKTFKDSFNFLRTEFGAIIAERINLQNEQDNIQGVINIISHGQKLLDNSSKIAKRLSEYTEEEKMQIQRLFTPEEYEYLKFIESYYNENAKNLLLNVINDSSKDIKHRLYAFALLSMLLSPDSAKNMNFSGLINDFADKLENGEIQINNNYDLQAVLAGLHNLVMANKILSGKDENTMFDRHKLYLEILYAFRIDLSGGIKAENIKSILKGIYKKHRVNINKYGIDYTALFSSLNSLPLRNLDDSSGTLVIDSDFEYLENTNLEENLTDEDDSFAAILPENKEMVEQMIAAGEKPLKISLKVVAAEFVRSLNPWKFIKDHDTTGGKIGAAIVSLSTYAPLVMLSAALLFTPLSLAVLPAVASLLGSVFAGFMLNAVIHTVMDFIYINETAHFDQYDPEQEIVNDGKSGKNTIINYIKQNKFKTVAVVLAVFMVVSLFIYQTIQFKNTEREIARLQQELDNLYFPPQAEFFDKLFTKERMRNFDIPEDDAAFEKAKQESIEASLKEENIELIKEVYGRLRDAGITFDRNYTIFFIKVDGIYLTKNAFSLPELNLIFLPTNMIDFENFSREEIIINLAEIIAHEGQHIDDYLNNPSMSSLEGELRCWEAAANAREAVGGIDEISEQGRKTVQAFRIIVNKLDALTKAVYELGIEEQKEYISENPELDYLFVATDNTGDKDLENKIQIALYDRNLGEIKYVILCMVDVSENTLGFFINEYDEINSLDSDTSDDGAVSANSILPENLDMVNKMAHEGKGAGRISAAVSFKELWKSLIHPVKFINEHPSGSGKIGAAILAGITYAGVIALSISALFVPVLAVAVPAALFINITAHIIIDYHYIKASGLIEAVNEFGSAAALTEEGRVNLINLPVYIISELPENYQELALKNTGVSLEGNYLWVGKLKGAVVVYAKDIDPQIIAQELDSNRMINKFIKENASKTIKKSLKNISMTFIEVDHNAASRSINISENGNIKVSKDLMQENAKRGTLAEFSASLRKGHNADAKTYSDGIIHDINDIDTLEYLTEYLSQKDSDFQSKYINNFDDLKEYLGKKDSSLAALYLRIFKEYLEQHQKVGNGQIMISDPVYDEIMKNDGNIIGDLFSKFLAEARKDGVQVFVMSKEKKDQAKVQKYRAAGLTGYSYLISKDRGVLNNFVLDSETEFKMDEFNDLESLEENMRKSPGIYIIQNSMFKNAINSERSNIGINNIVKILSSVKILKVFHSKPITADFARSAARNFEITDIPNIKANNVEALQNLISAKDFSAAEFKNALGIRENAVDPVSVYLIKLESRTVNINEQDKREIIKAFMLGIIEKALAAENLRKAHKEYGLKDRNHEIILGRALFEKILHNIGNDNPDITPDSFRTVKEAEEKLNETLAALMPKAFENKDAKAINAIIELIPAIGQERKMFEINDTVKPAMNIRNYEKILTAA
ncbi:MAG: metallophosphoesterase [Endomicrobia bacterium]|nr:metallophosphoesterase [Endomicrobiia bacterium]